MDTELLTLVAALIGSGAATSVVQWILGHAERDTPTKEGLRVLLFCKLEHIQASMVANDGVCDVSTKRPQKPSTAPTAHWEATASARR